MGSTVNVRVVFNSIVNFNCLFLSSLGQAKDIMCDYRPGILENSAKMVLLFHLIEESVRKGDKLLVFRYEIRRQRNIFSFYFWIWLSSVLHYICITEALPAYDPISHFAFCLSPAVRVCPRWQWSRIFWLRDQFPHRPTCPTETDPTRTGSATSTTTVSDH